MLLWFAKGQPKLRVFRFKIFLISFCLHLILLIIGLFFESRQLLKIEVKNRHYNKIPVILLPFSKRVPGALKTVKNIGGQISQATINKSKIVVPGNAAKNKINEVKNSKVQELKKEIKKIKIDPKKENKIKTDQIKKDIGKIKEKILKKEIIKKIEQKEINEIINNEKLISQQVIAENVNISNEDIYVGIKDIEQFEFEQLIENEISKNWQPPVGLSKKLTCKLQAYIDLEGKVKNITIVESSKSIAFDMSAKRDLSKANFPREIWGYEIAPQYGPEE